ncbi:MAG TPA: DUF3348 domain-containing protein [Burkholderiaceae bacterium]|nr:DUF3348 domain-containing protein [Burkholderiaceae bacterium]
MVQESPGTRFTGSTLIRLLTQLTGPLIGESKQAFSERLSQWVTWTDAIELSATLQGRPTRTPAAPAPAKPFEQGDEARELERELDALRNAFAKSIAEDCAPRLGKQGANAPVPAKAAPFVDMPLDFAPYRRRCLSRQQAMEAGISALRSRLRTALSQRSPHMARLAALDEVMDNTLGPREHALLAAVPKFLEKHFERLRKTRDELPAEDTPSPDEPWLDLFCKDMHAALLAELDVRLQPLEGLLEALRKTPREPS